MNLKRIGWNTDLEEKFELYKENNSLENIFVGRIALEFKTRYRVFSEFGEIDAVISDKIRSKSTLTTEDIDGTLGNALPKVGDWVIFTYEEKDKLGIIKRVLPRKSKFSRNSAGKSAEEQIIATNVDITFLVNALNDDFNPRRIERYLTAIWESGTSPVILLNKADLCDDVDRMIEDVEDISFGVPIFAVSAFDGSGLDSIREYIKDDKTCVFIGSSGVGKSTIINALLGEERQKTQALSKYKDKGKHTTTNREMIVLEDGGVVIDTPGIREIQLWTNEGSMSNLFEDVEEIIRQCRFSDCKHKTEPGCAVIKALEDGTLDEKRLKNYYKLQRELAYIRRKTKRKFDWRERVGYKEEKRLNEKAVKKQIRLDRKMG